LPTPFAPGLQPSFNIFEGISATFFHPDKPEIPLVTTIAIVMVNEIFQEGIVEGRHYLSS
jgi:hypothetical protein